VLFKKFNVLNHAMNEALTKQKGPLDERDLERMKKKCPKLNYLTKRAVMDADVFDKLINVKSVKEFYALPPAALQPKMDVLAQDRAEVEQLVEAKGKPLEGTSGVESDTSKFADFLKEAKMVTRRIRHQAKFTDSKLDRLGRFAGWMTDGSSNKSNHNHESRIRRYTQHASFGTMDLHACELRLWCTVLQNDWTSHVE